MLKYLSRKTTSLVFIPEIDGLRFFAIFTVILYHLNTALSGAISFDWKEYYGMEYALELGWWIVRLDMGVKVFFAISGLVLALPFLKYYMENGKKIDIKTYFIRRLLRLEPPFIISLLIFYLFQIILLDVNILEYTQHLLANLFYSHGFLYGYPSPINPVTWSLETEAQFYIFIPFFMYFLFYFNKKYLRFTILISTFILGLYLRKYIFTHDLHHFTSSILVYLTNFVTGISFAWLFIKKPKFLKRKKILYDLIGLIALFCMFNFYKPQSSYLNNIMFNFSIFVFFISAFKGVLLNWFFKRKLIFTIGGMCYTIYLIHFGFFYFLSQKIHMLLPEIAYTFQLIYFGIISFSLLSIVCIAFFILIEKPCMDKNWPVKLKSFLTKTK